MPAYTSAHQPAPVQPPHHPPLHPPTQQVAGLWQRTGVRRGDCLPQCRAQVFRSPRSRQRCPQGGEGTMGGCRAAEGTRWCQEREGRAGAGGGRAWSASLITSLRNMPHWQRTAPRMDSGASGAHRPRAARSSCQVTSAGWNRRGCASSRPPVHCCHATPQPLHTVCLPSPMATSSVGT